MINVKKGEVVIIGFKMIGLTSYETETVTKVTKDKINTDYSDYPFSRETGINENDAFGATKYIVTDEAEIEKAKESWRKES